jgi:hypothetical protein
LLGGLYLTGLSQRPASRPWTSDNFDLTHGVTANPAIFHRIVKHGRGAGKLFISACPFGGTSEPLPHAALHGTKVALALAVSDRRRADRGACRQRPAIARLL